MWGTAASTGFPAGAVTLVLINFATDSSKNFELSNLGTVGDAHVYALLGQPGPTGLPPSPSAAAILALVESPAIYLNGASKPLTVEEAKAGSLKPHVVKQWKALELPPLGVALVVLPNATARACAS